MARATKLDRLYEDVGELLARHGDGTGTEELSAYADRPVAFIRDVLDGEPWSRQVEVAEAVRDNPMVAVQSCNGTGKDWLAGRLALWWVYARGGLVVLTGPTRQQVEEILMRREVRDAFTGSGLPGTLHVRALRRGGEGRAGIIAKTASAVSALTGLHDNDVLFCCSEAQHEGLDVAFDAAFANAVGERDRIMVYGNPLNPAGPFYNACKSPEWRQVKIPAAATPNVQEGETVVPGLMTRQGVDRIRQQYGEDSPYFQARVLAEFPAQSEEALIRREWLDRATEAHRKARDGDALDFHAEGADVVLGVDPARRGPDATAVAIRQGALLREVRCWRGESRTTDTVARVRGLLDELTGPDSPKVAAVAVDEIGVGGGVVDGLEDALRGRKYPHKPEARGRRRPPRRESEIDVVAFNSSKSATDTERFLNVRAAAYWRVRDALERSELLLPPDAELIEELAALRWQVAGAGQVQIEAKADLRSRLGRSPDRADAVAMSYGPEVVERTIKRVMVGP